MIELKIKADKGRQLILKSPVSLKDYQTLIEILKVLNGDSKCAKNVF